MNNDLISRQAAIDALDKRFDSIPMEQTAEILKLRKDLRELPPVQPELCEDAISRQAARHALCKAVHKDEDIPCDNQTGSCLWTGTRVCDYVREIDALPSAQPEPKWIPVERKLPEDYTDVLVWFEYFRYGDYNCLYQTHGIGTYVAEYNLWMINHESGWKDLRVIAWMPLPEPYNPNNK